MDSKLDRCAKRRKTAALLDHYVVRPLALFVFVFLVGCKENKWAEWKVQNEIWLETNKKEAGVQVSTTGLQYKIIADPTPQDARPNTTSTIVCDYTLKLINGYQVDAGNNVAFNFATQSIIPGFIEGCRKIHNNGDIEFYIPAYLGYDQEKYRTNDYGNAEGFGVEGSQVYIPPYSTLIYTVHLCSVSD